MSRAQQTEGTAGMYPFRTQSPAQHPAIPCPYASSQGAASPFHAHITSMPSSHDCPFAWSEAEFSPLLETDIDPGLREAGLELYEEAARELASRYPQAWPEFTYERFAWAAGMVQSRTFHLQATNWVTGGTSDGCELYLLPGIDMVNHSSQAEQRSTELRFTPDRTAGGERIPGEFTMLASRAISSGEEILFTYGDLSDTELLHTYGFVEGLDVPRSQGQACVQLADVLIGCGGARAQRGASGSDRCACEAIRAYLAPADAFQVSVAGSIPPTGLLFAVQMLLGGKKDLQTICERFEAWDPQDADTEQPKPLAVKKEHLAAVGAALESARARVSAAIEGLQPDAALRARAAWTLCMLQHRVLEKVKQAVEQAAES
ncbi:hypothetical protein ACKKBF_B05025 [Auxenochlorella protothecoides x Auxenochlorella symbiontica]